MAAAGLLLSVSGARGDGHADLQPPSALSGATESARPAALTDTTGSDTLPRFLGTVRSRQTGETVSGAEVRIPAQDRATLTDDRGRFRLDGLDPGRHEVRVHYLGYTTNPRVVELRPRHSTRADLWLERTVLAVEELEVRVTRPRADPMAGFRDRRDDGFGIFLDRGDIEDRNPAQTSDLFRSMAGVSVGPNRMGMARVTVRRFGGRCPPTVYVDGVLTTGIPVDFIMPESIIGIEVYRGASEVPPQFNKPTEQGCGAILIWTWDPGHTPPGMEPDSTS